MYSYGSPHMAAQKQDDQLERTFSSYVRIQDVVLKTYLGRWTIGRSGERGSGISVLPARYDDDDNYCPGSNNYKIYTLSTFMKVLYSLVWHLAISLGQLIAMVIVCEASNYKKTKHYSNKYPFMVNFKIFLHSRDVNAWILYRTIVKAWNLGVSIN